MENPPKPKPRKTFLFIDESNKTPVPTPRNRLSTVSTNSSGTSASGTYCNQMPNVFNEQLNSPTNLVESDQQSTSMKTNSSPIELPDIKARISLTLPAQSANHFNDPGSDNDNNNGSEDNTVEGHNRMTSYFDSSNCNVGPCSGTDTYSIPNLQPLIARTIEDNQVSLRHPYENWNIFDGHVVPQPIARPSKSTIIEFDPLNAIPTPSTNTNEKLLVQSFLDNESSAAANKDEEFDLYPEVSFDDDYFSAPEPPERSDSLELSKTSTKWFLDESHDDRKSVSGDSFKSSNNVSLKKMFSNMLTKKTKEYIKQPSLAELPGVFHSGPLTRIVSSVVEFKNKHVRHCVLKDNKMFCYNDSSCSIVKEEINMELVTSLQISLPLSSSSSDNTYCFVLMCLESLKSSKKVTFSCADAADRYIWAQKILETIAPHFPSKYTCKYTRLGWCYLKEGIGGKWQGAYILLSRRSLIYYTTSESVAKVIDLRKTSNIVVHVTDEDVRSSFLSDSHNHIIIDNPEITMYLHLPSEREHKLWLAILNLSAHNNGIHIHHQQLTKDDVPTIVDKCINFLYANGSLSEGLYRRAGSTLVLNELLSRFRSDAWAVQLSTSEHTEHDIAGVLKRFFRDLPEPLIERRLHQQFIAALNLPDKTARYSEFKILLSELSLISRRTVRKLFRHLYFLQSLQEYNKMSAENLASVWAPNIMPWANMEVSLSWSSKELMVVRELILEYETIWQPTEQEKQHEAETKKYLMQVKNESTVKTNKSAGDLRIWVYVHDKSTCYQIFLSPNKSSSEVCQELCDKTGLESHLLMLVEVICGGSMRRILHIDECVLDVVLRWSYWDDEDRKDNYLLLTENKIMYELDALKNKTSVVSGELKFANQSSKTFKMHMFKFHNNVLSYCKDKANSQQVNEWNINEIIWYIGHESKRNPKTDWALTFINKNNKILRSKDNPWFGLTIAGLNTKEQLRWMSAMMFAQYRDILPTPRLVITD